MCGLEEKMSFVYNNWYISSLDWVKGLMFTVRWFGPPIQQSTPFSIKILMESTSPLVTVARHREIYAKQYGQLVCVSFQWAWSASKNTHLAANSHIRVAEVAWSRKPPAPRMIRWYSGQKVIRLDYHSSLPNMVHKHLDRRMSVSHSILQGGIEKYVPSTNFIMISRR